MYQKIVIVVVSEDTVVIVEVSEDTTGKKISYINKLLLLWGVKMWFGKKRLVAKKRT